MELDQFIKASLLHWWNEIVLSRHNPEKLIVSKYVNRKIKMKCAKQRERDLMLLHCVLVL